MRQRVLPTARAFSRHYEFETESMFLHGYLSLRKRKWPNGSCSALSNETMAAFNGGNSRLETRSDMIKFSKEMVPCRRAAAEPAFEWQRP